MFYYLKNTQNLKSVIAADTIPLFWIFEHFDDPHYSWTAFTYAAIFINGLLVSFFELIAVLFYFAGEMRWLAWYANSIGWIFAVFGMLVPVTFSAL
jgi:hypothetical protein